MLFFSAHIMNFPVKLYIYGTCSLEVYAQLQHRYHQNTGSRGILEILSHTVCSCICCVNECWSSHLTFGHLCFSFCDVKSLLAGLPRVNEDFSFSLHNGLSQQPLLWLIPRWNSKAVKKFSKMWELLLSAMWNHLCKIYAGLGVIWRPGSCRPHASSQSADGHWNVLCYLTRKTYTCKEIVGCMSEMTRNVTVASGRLPESWLKHQSNDGICRQWHLHCRQYAS